MKVTRSTLVLIAIALSLGVIAYLTTLFAPPTDNAEPQPLFGFEEDDVQAFTLDRGEQTLTFERQNDGNWQMVQPDPGPADPAAVVYLLNLLATEESNRRIPTAPSDLEDFGLDTPLAEVDITLAAGETHQLILGSYDFSNQFIYALTDSSDPSPAAEPADEAADTLPVHLVSPSFDAAVSRPIAEWQAAPEPESPPPGGTPDGEPGPSGLPDTIPEEAD